MNSLYEVTSKWTFDTVSIVHGGDDESLAIINKLTEECKLRNIHIEYKIYESSQDKASLILHYLEDYKKMKLPIIVIIALDLLNIIWTTTLKTKFINSITSYSPMTHIWSRDINFNILRTYSSLLCWRHGSFKIIELSEFQDISLLNLALLESLADYKLRKEDVRYCVEDGRKHSFPRMQRNFHYQFGKLNLNSPLSLPPMSSLSPMSSPSEINDDSKSYTSLPPMGSPPPMLQLLEKDVSQKDVSQRTSKKKKRKKNTKSKLVSGCTEKY